MNYKQKIITELKKSTTVLATMLILGQTFMPGATAFAESNESTSSATEQTTSTMETVKQVENTESTQTSDFSEKAKEIINDPLLTETEKTEQMYSIFSGMGKVSFGYTNESGEQVTVQEKQNRFKRSALDMSEYTPYSFRVDLNGYWAEGQMPVLKMDGEVVFCIEPGVAAQAGEGYTPADLTAQQREWFENIGNFGYTKEQSHEMYYTSQGYMWQKMGASFSGSYDGFEAKKAQIDTNIADYYTKPSFDKQKITVKMGEPVTLTDTNGVLGEYVKDVSTGGLKLTRNGNQLTIAVTEETSDNAQIKLRKTMTDGVSIAYIKEGSQMIGKFSVSDPAQTTIDVEAIKEGQIQIGKQDKVTGKMLPNTTYTGTIGKDKATFTTGADGWGPLSNKYVDGTEYNLVETAVPAGYTLDQTPITGTIKGGETTKLVQKNDIQQALLTIEKDIEVFKPEETTQQGKPVYEIVPAESIPFTLKNDNDTTAPDGKTVIQAAGEYSDTQVTDKEGKATFKPFYHGAQNPYKLTEDETPKNYRPMETKTIVKEYGDSTIKAVAYTEKITNLRQKGNLKFNKKNSIDLSNPLNLEKAKFSLKGLPNTPVSDVFLTFDTTKETNEINDLPAGTYEVTEIKTPNGFQTPIGQTNVRYITIEDDKTTTVDWENQPITPETPKKAPMTPVATSTPTKTTGTLPHTGEKSMSWVSILGVTSIIVAGTGAYVLYKRKKNVA